MSVTVPKDSYAEVSDVEARMQSRVTFSTSTVPTLAQVEAYLTDTFHEINAMLRRAGYFVPMTVNGNQLNIGTQLQLNAAIQVDDTEIPLKDSGGSLTGAIVEGDIFEIVGDNQDYVAIEGESAGSDNLVAVAITPPIRVAAAASVNVTHTPNLQAINVLSSLHAYMAAAYAERALSTAGGDEESDNAKALQDQSDRRWKGIESGAMPLIGARKSHKRTPPGAVRLERRG